MKDKYGRRVDYMRISITEKCNYRCFYCMPQNSEEEISEEKKISKEKKSLSKDEIINLVKAGAKLGIKKLRITGGEPFVRTDIDDILREISQIKGIDELCLTTNGSLLNEKIELLKECKVNKINVSIDTLNHEKFRKITKTGNLAKVWCGIDKAIKSGIKVKINSVIVKGVNDTEIINLAELTETHPVDLRFIELMPIGEGKKYTGFSGEEIRKIISVKKKLTNLNLREGTSEYYSFESAKGRLGFINPLSNCFCAECNKIRITSKGEVKQCLNKKSNINISEVMQKMTNHNEIIDVISGEIYNKPEKHMFNLINKNEEEYNMNKIGG